MSGTPQHVLKRICSVCKKALQEGEEAVEVNAQLDGNGFGPVWWACEPCSELGVPEKPWPEEMGQ